MLLGLKKALQTIKFKTESLINKSKYQILGSRDYQKFVIVSDSRTGSTLLMDLLNYHPNIIALGEEFRDLKGNTCKEIWNKIYSKRSKRIKWVGFKLFYHHPRDNNDQEVWDIIENDPTIVIIHLVRKNILRSYVSKVIGLKTRKWTENISSKETINLENKRVTLDADDCRDNFEKISKYVERTNRRFKNHNIVSVEYERLAEDKQGEINLIYEKLNLPKKKIFTSLKKAKSGAFKRFNN